MKTAVVLTAALVSGCVTDSETAVRIEALERMQTMLIHSHNHNAERLGRIASDVRYLKANAVLGAGNVTTVGDR